MCQDTASLILLFHGSGDSQNPIWQSTEQDLSAKMPESQVLLYDWGVASDSRLRTASNGKALGRAQSHEGPRMIAAKRAASR